MKSTRREFFQAASIATAFACLDVGCSSTETTEAIPRLWYRQPAVEWMEALPIGNGRLGAMVFGGVAQEKLQLNEDTLWSGPPPQDWNNPEAKQYLPQVRRLLMEEGKYVEANELAKKMQGPFNESFQPLGNFHLAFPGAEQFSDYRRELNLDTAVASTTYSIGDARYTREIFSSAVDQVIVIRLSCDQPDRISFVATMDSLLRAETNEVSPDGFALRGKSPSHVDPDYIEYRTNNVIYSDELGKGMHFEASLKVIHDGGQLTINQDSLKVENANAVTILVAGGTGYKGFQHPPDGTPEEIAAGCRKQLEAAAKKSYDRLLADHVADYQQLFRRVTLRLGDSSTSGQPTDERLRSFSDRPDSDLEALYYQYGRYLLIASSRPGTEPANLQGIWTRSIRPPWSANWTLNINAQMNYWNAEVGNLSECHTPLFDLTENLAVNGVETARVYYGLDGWVAHHNADLWAQAPPVGESGPNGNPRWSNWPMGGAWLCQHLWEHYAFTEDEDFLRRRAYPLMKGAAVFMLGWLIEDKQGRLVTCPATSPENEFYPPGDKETVAVSVASTMDMALIRELFTNCIESCRILGIDTDFSEKLAAARSRLFPFQVGKHGQLQEWSEDFEEPTPGQGHISHLYPVHPGNQITVRGTPDLARAAAASLDRRIEHGAGSGGWPAAWYINQWARLEEAEKAHTSLQAMLKNRTTPNLFSGRTAQFQIDGNFGGSAGIVEMLLQSHTGEINFLPALPAAWAEGEFKGLCARGVLEINLTWRDGKAVTAVLKAGADGERRLRPPSGQQIMSVRAGDQTVALDSSSDGTVAVSLRAGSRYDVTFG